MAEGYLGLCRPQIRSLLKPRATGPTLFRDRSHCPEEGLGGDCYWVTYRGENIGAVRRTWDARGVHWEADLDDGRTVAEDEEDRPRAFATLADAINMLFRAIGVEDDYKGSEQTWNTRHSG